MRIFKIIYLIPTLRSIFQIVLSSMRRVINMISLAVYFMIPYALYGFVLFSNLFNQCNDPTISTVNECTGTFINSDTNILQPRVWSTSTYPNFDSFSESIWTLFELIMVLP